MKDKKTLATIIGTNKFIHILTEIQCHHIADLNLKVPKKMISMNLSCNNLHSIIIIKNLEKEPLHVEYGSSKSSNMFSPVSLSLCGKYFPPEKINSVKTVNLETILPTYK